MNKKYQILEENGYKYLVAFDVITTGDKYINYCNWYFAKDDFTIFDCKSLDNALWINKTNFDTEIPTFLKVVATTDPSIGLPIIIDVNQHIVNLKNDKFDNGQLCEVCEKEAEEGTGICSECRGLE